MPLTVLNVAYPLAPVSLDAVGGAEQVLAHIDVALARAGHDSLVIACEGSVIAGTLLETPLVPGVLSDQVQCHAQAQHRAAIAAALGRWSIDVIHMHGIDFPAYVPPPGVPVLVTLHVPPDWYAAGAFSLDRPRTYLHCVSSAQRRACPAEARLLPDIENGVDVERLASRHGKRRYVMALGRICREKGFHLALDAAARARMPCVLAGKVYPYAAHQEYFQQHIAPRLDRCRRFVGPVGLARKRRLLGAARALLVPSQVPETSSLVAMEALACGTPVIAFPVGALPDIVEHGTTGYLVSTVEEMADAIEAAGELDPDVCRQVARERFSMERMTARYLEVYRHLAGQYSDSDSDSAPPVPDRQPTDN